MDSILELIIIVSLVIIQSIFGVGLLLFGTPSLLLLGYDFANTINILMPVSISISAIQFFKSKNRDINFIKEYNLFCLPFLIFFLIIALKFNYIFNFKLIVALLLVISSLIILNKSKFSFKKIFFKIRKLVLMGIGPIHGLTNMGGGFLAIYSTIVSRNNKEFSRYYICYGYLIMGIIQYSTVLILNYDNLFSINYIMFF